jgi:hypothetical protein
LHKKHGIASLRRTETMLWLAQVAQFDPLRNFLQGPLFRADSHNKFYAATSFSGFHAHDAPPFARLTHIRYPHLRTTCSSSSTLQRLLIGSSSPTIAHRKKARYRSKRIGQLGTSVCALQIFGGLDWARIMTLYNSQDLVGGSQIEDVPCLVLINAYLCHCLF